jgi:hypothetical protein
MNFHPGTDGSIADLRDWLGTSWLLGFDWFGFWDTNKPVEIGSLFRLGKNRVSCLSWDIGATKLGSFPN